MVPTGISGCSENILKNPTASCKFVYCYSLFFCIFLSLFSLFLHTCLQRVAAPASPDALWPPAIGSAPEAGFEKKKKGKKPRRIHAQKQGCKLQVRLLLFSLFWIFTLFFWIFLSFFSLFWIFLSLLSLFLHTCLPRVAAPASPAAL